MATGACAAAAAPARRAHKFFFRGTFHVCILVNDEAANDATWHVATNDSVVAYRYGRSNDAAEPKNTHLVGFIGEQSVR